MMSLDTSLDTRLRNGYQICVGTHFWLWCGAERCGWLFGEWERVGVLTRLLNSPRLLKGIALSSSCHVMPFHGMYTCGEKGAVRTCGVERSATQHATQIFYPTLTLHSFADFLSRLPPKSPPLTAGK